MENKNEFDIENTASVDKEGENGNFLALAPQNNVKALEKVQSMTKIIDGAVRLALQRTVAQDWVCMGGKYYLQASGVEKIRSVFGLYFKDIKIAKEDYSDGSYSYICFGTAGVKLLDQLFGETTIQIEGCRSSSDQFFSSQAQTDPMDVRRAAYANFQVRAAKALLGFGNYSASDLENMGVKVNQMAKVNYEKGAEGGVKTGCISVPQQKRLFAICANSGISQDSAKQYLQKNFSISSSKDIQRKDYERICKWAESGSEEAPEGGFLPEEEV